MAAEWPQYLQSVIFGVVSSFLLAKLFSVIFSFHEEDIRITRSHQTESESNPLSSSDRVLEETAAISDDGWEGVESTELDETFSAATAFVAAMAADRAAQKVSNEVQLQLYGLYKIATEGPCSAAQPSAFKMTARAKWQAWKKLGVMPPEEAMQKYIGIVTGLYPSWPASSLVKKNGEESSHASSAGSKGTMGPVLSTFIYEEEPESELKMEAIHRFAREGDEEKLLECILNLKGCERKRPETIHSYELGFLKDHEGQIALHYAAILVEHGADLGIKDDEGKLKWPWMQTAPTEAHRLCSPTMLIASVFGVQPCLHLNL